MGKNWTVVLRGAFEELGGADFEVDIASETGAFGYLRCTLARPTKPV
jgi:hypothetical protein